MKFYTLVLCLVILCVFVHESLAHHTICHYPMEAGPCRAALQRWGYDGSQCVQFIYGGCKGNTNNFVSKEECENACLHQNE